MGLAAETWVVQIYPRSVPRFQQTIMAVRQNHD